MKILEGLKYFALIELKNLFEYKLKRFYLLVHLSAIFSETIEDDYF